MLRLFSIVLIISIFTANAFPQGLVINIEDVETATVSLNQNNLSITTDNMVSTYAIEADRLTLDSTVSNLHCEAIIAGAAPKCALPTGNNITHIKATTEFQWKCSNEKSDRFYRKMDRDNASKIRREDLKKYFKEKKITDVRIDSFINCLVNLDRLASSNSSSLICTKKPNNKLSCENGIIKLSETDGNRETSYVTQISILCGIPELYASDLKLIDILIGGIDGGISSDIAAELANDNLPAKAAVVPETLACQGCGKLAQQIQQTSDPGQRSQLLQQLSSRLKPAISAAFGPSVAYAGSRSSISTASSTTRTPNGSSVGRPRLPASYTGSRQNNFSNSESDSDSNTGTSSGFEASESSSTPGNSGQSVETSAQSSSGLGISSESARSAIDGNVGGSAGISASTSSGGSSTGSGSAPPSDTFLGGNLTTQQQGIKARLTAAPNADRARLVQTRQMISELANNGVQVRFSYKTDTYGVPKTGAPEIIWIIDRQGKITEYNPN